MVHPFSLREVSLNFFKPADWTVQGYLGQQKKRVEARLAQLPLGSGKSTKAKEAMVYALQTPGKRFRPLLTIACADIYRMGHLDLVLDAAVAVECIHTSSLLFDDLPNMDDAKMRRGRATTHTIYGEDQAILAGMSLIGEANMLLAGQFKDRKSQLARKLECVHVLNASYAIEGLSGGQSDDLLNKASLSFEELEYIHSKKTGSLFVACVEIAAILSDAKEQERKWLKSYARSLGLAFQIQDDLLDLLDSSETGKDKGKDEGKTTFVTIFGGDECKRIYNRLIDVALENLVPFGSSANHLVELTRIIQTRKF